MCVLVLLLLEW